MKKVAETNNTTTDSNESVENVNPTTLTSAFAAASNMTFEDSVKVLEQSVALSQKAGVFSLDDSVYIAKALEILKSVKVSNTNEKA